MYLYFQHVHYYQHSLQFCTVTRDQIEEEDVF